MASQLLTVQPRESFKRNEEAESPGLIRRAQHSCGLEAP
jgi:hypothetical protein